MYRYDTELQMLAKLPPFAIIFQRRQGISKNTFFCFKFVVFLMNGVRSLTGEGVFRVSVFVVLTSLFEDAE